MNIGHNDRYTVFINSGTAPPSQSGEDLSKPKEAIKPGIPVHGVQPCTDARPNFTEAR